MGSEQARWSLKVSRDTVITLRTLLATRGGKKGDLSRFVEEAVNREVLRETIRDLHTQNADINSAEIDRHRAGSHRTIAPDHRRQKYLILLEKRSPEDEFGQNGIIAKIGKW